MNGYDRINTVLNGGIPDRVPIILHNFMPAVRERGITMDEFRKDPRRMAECFIDYTEKYDLDGVLLDVDTALLAGACGAQVAFRENEPAVVTGSSGSTADEIVSKIR